MLKIKLLAFRDAPASVFEKGEARIEKLVSPGHYILTESDPDVLFFLSGGSEQLAMEQVVTGRFYLLVGSKHDNSYASATEVKACLNSMNIKSVLLDEEEFQTKEVLESFTRMSEAFERLKGKRLGLIGEVSGWLIAF